MCVLGQACSQVPSINTFICDKALLKGQLLTIVYVHECVCVSETIILMLPLPFITVEPNNTENYDTEKILVK